LISYLLIVNCKANSGRAKGQIKRNLNRINSALDNPEIIYIDEPSGIESIARKASEHAECVISCGGDGTMQNIARGLYGSNCKMGVIPIGSGNDFVKALHILPHQSLDYYLNIIINNETRKIDLPALNGQIFINTCGIGFDGLTNYLSSKSSLNGSLKYLISGFRAFLSARPFYVSIKSLPDLIFDGKIWMIAIANGSTEGGKYRISPNSDNSDGVLELVVVPAYSRIKLIIAFILLSMKIPLTEKFFGITPVKSAQIEITEDHFIHMDGEVCAPTKEYDLQILPEKLTVIGNSVS